MLKIQQKEKVSSYEKVYNGKVSKVWGRSSGGCSVSGMRDL